MIMKFDPERSFASAYADTEPFMSPALLFPRTEDFHP
jgi:hypothetical protein